mgnify:CR=1 FL=1
MKNKSKKILSEISVGELFDKITILEIKLDKVKDKQNKEEINKEYNILKNVQSLNIEITENIKKLLTQLKDVNLNLWDIEDKLRILEKEKNFGNNFIKLARGVYFNNDRRSKLKSEINKIVGSNIVEIKQYVDY